MLAISKNWLHLVDCTIDTGASSPVLNTASTWENVFNYYPSRPLRFSAATLPPADIPEGKRLRINLGATRICNAAAIIETHSNQTDTVTNDSTLEQRVQLRIYAGTVLNPLATLVADWHGLLGVQTDRWGENLFRSFASDVPAQIWTFDFRVVDASTSPVNFGALSVGCVILGQYYAFPEGPLVEHRRSGTAVATVIGRPFGTVQMWQREDSIRRFDIGTFHKDEDSRVILEALIMGRGRRRLAGNEFAKKRLDIPTALIMPDMWFDTTGLHGGCVFGRFTGIESAMRTGARAITGVQYEEVI